MVARSLLYGRDCEGHDVILLEVLDGENKFLRTDSAHWSVRESAFPTPAIWQDLA